MKLETFRRISRQIDELAKSKIKFDVAIRNDHEGSIADTAQFVPINFEVNSLKQLSQIQQISNQPISLVDPYGNAQTNKVSLSGVKPKACVGRTVDVITSIKNKPALKQNYPTLKFFTDQSKNFYYNFDIAMIHTEPTEQLEGDVTYRYIGDEKVCLYCIPHTHDLYHYLDKGFFFLNMANHRSNNTKLPPLVITNELTLDTFLVMILVNLNPEFTKDLQQGMFINANVAKVLRIKFEKALNAQHKPNYERFRQQVMVEYEKSVNSNLLQRIIEKKIDSASYNGVKLTLTSAKYEGVSIEADDLLHVLQVKVGFDDRTDIYSLIRGYLTYAIDEIETKASEKISSSAAGDWKVEKSFKVNGINIKIGRTSDNTRRYVNDMMINKIELDPVCNRASCFEDQDTFDKFVTQVNKMSLKWHDVLANGIGVKVHGGMTYADYQWPKAPTGSPKLKFKKYGTRDFKLVVNEGEEVKVKFNYCMTAMEKFNRSVNNYYTNDGGYNRRDATWACAKLPAILKECCTFDEKEVTTDANGVKSTQTKKVCYMTDAQSKVIVELAKKLQEKAIEKSKLFLAQAVKATGSKEIEFKGAKGYLVEGKLRKYFVNKDTNQVLNYDDNGRHICIVEHGHQVSVGCDATAARIYALKHDAVTVNKIGTLKHG